MTHPLINQLSETAAVAAAEVATGWPIPLAASVLKRSRTGLYNAIRRRQIRSIKLAGKRYILHSEIERLLGGAQITVGDPLTSREKP